MDRHEEQTNITCDNDNRNQKKMKRDYPFTRIKKLAIEFITMFTVALVVTAIITFLWNIIRHGESTIDWEIPFRFAIIFGMILTRVKSREIKEK